MPTRLEIYIEGGCKNCLPAISIAERVQGEMPAIQVSLIDLKQEPQQRPKKVFAVPTYILDGEILSLGNPRMDDLLAALRERSGTPTYEVAENEHSEDSRADAD